MPDRLPSLAEAEATLAAAREAVAEEEGKLCQARTSLAASERELERLADVVAGGAGDRLRKAMQEAALLVREAGLAELLLAVAAAA